MVFSTCSADNSIGPGVSGCRDEFDFTILFELVFFSLVPSVVFIILSIWRSILLLAKPTIVNAPILQLVKLCAITAYVGLQLALLVLVSIGPFGVTGLFIACTVMTFVAAVCMIGLSCLDHARSPRPSMLLSGYLFLTLLFDMAETRTFWLASSTRSELAFAGVFTAAMGTKILLLLLEAQHKTRWIRWDTKDPHSPEETSGIFDLGVYFWLNSLFANGYRKILKIHDLYPLDHAMNGEILHQKFQKNLSYSKLRADKHGLVKALCSTLAVPLLLPVIPRLVLLGFTFCQPFFINRLLAYLSENESVAFKNTGYGLIAASVFIYSGIALSTAIYQYFHHRSLQMARACLVTAIYTKATEAQVTADEESASVTLMSSDIERIRMGFRSLHDMWASIIEVALASWLLYNQLGVAFLAPILVVIVCSSITSYLVRFTGGWQKAWMAAAQKRVGLTAAVISNMKNLKISGLTVPVGDFVQKLRLVELAASGRFRLLIVFAAFIGFCPLYLSPVLTFAVARATLDATKIFTSLSYLTLLSTPLTQLLQGIPQTFAGIACIQRIQAFLELDSRDDFRRALSTSREAIQSELPPGGNGSVLQVSTENALTIKNGQFGWTSNKIVLRDINITIPKESFTIIVGPVASGKSTLCKALLGELPVHRGTISAGLGLSRLAYCDQAPFLSNGTIRDNITGFSSFDSKRYSDVLNATMLVFDLDTMPDGDRTNIGSDGITLSGGQKQRVALARALYLQTDLLILDDVFSGLDADTEEQVFRGVFGPDGLLRRRRATVILCTHSVRHLPAADHIIALGSDSTVTEQGTFTDLMGKGQGYVQSLGVKSSVSSAASINSKEDTAAPEIRPSLLNRATTATSAFSEPGDKNRQLGDRGVYKHYIKSMGYFLSVSVIFWGIAQGFTHNFATVWLTYWSNDLESASPSRSWSYYLGIYGLLSAGALLTLLGLAVVVFYFSVMKAGASIHGEALETLIKAPLRFFTTTDQGQIINLFSQDINLIDTELPNGLLNAVSCVFVATGQAAVLVTTSPYIAISYPFLVALLWLIQRFYLRTSRQMRLLDLEAKAPLYTHFLDTTKGIITLRAFGFLSEDKAKNIRLLDTSQRPAYLLQMIQNWLNLVLGLVVMAIAVLLTALAVETHSNSGFTGASLVTLMSFGEQLTVIVLYMTQLETSLGAITRLRNFNATIQAEDKPEEDILPPKEWPQHGAVELRGVSASYGVTNDENIAEKPDLALRDVRLSIAPGERIAICGRTGSGKSSLIALLLKLLDPTAETAEGICIDETALHRVDRATLRQRIIAVPQEAVFLPDGSSFRVNLDPFDASTPEDCQSVLEVVDLWPFVQERGGLDAGMSPGTFSQGQRQLFSLARAVLRRRIRAKSLGIGGGGSEGGILLLDEVSSSVDQETERAMQEIIRVEFKAYTVIAVSHRLDMIIDFDRVVVMDKGEIIEVGNPRTLSGDETTRFGELWKAGGN
ncbi:putative ABC multidrug transporter [Seiridium cardinale]